MLVGWLILIGVHGCAIDRQGSAPDERIAPPDEVPIDPAFPDAGAPDGAVAPEEPPVEPPPASCVRSADCGPACTCEPGCDCTLTCLDDACNAGCMPGSTCAVQGGGHDLIARCDGEASCEVDARNAVYAHTTCAPGSTCNVRCGGAWLCDVHCLAGAQCLVRCPDTLDCGYGVCAGVQQRCPDGSIACNRPCDG